MKEKQQIPFFKFLLTKLRIKPSLLTSHENAVTLVTPQQIVPVLVRQELEVAL